jgi:hypothetical protein
MQHIGIKKQINNKNGASIKAINNQNKKIVLLQDN